MVHKKHHWLCSHWIKYFYCLLGMQQFGVHEHAFFLTGYNSRNSRICISWWNLCRKHKTFREVNQLFKLSFLRQINYLSFSSVFFFTSYTCSFNVMLTIFPDPFVVHQPKAYWPWFCYLLILFLDVILSTLYYSLQ